MAWTGTKKLTKDAYQLNILQLIALRSSRILLWSHMRHITPVIILVVPRRKRRIIDEAIHARSINGTAKIVHLGGIGSMPTQVNSCVLCGLSKHSGKNEAQQGH